MSFSSYPAKGGIPSGNTAARPSSPTIGDTFYDGTIGFLLIWDGAQWLPCSAPAAQPTIAVTDVGTSVAYGTVQGSVAFTEGTSGGKAAGFTAVQESITSTSITSPIVLTLTENPGSYSFSGTAYNGFGTSPSALSVSQTLTSLPQAPTIGTATASGSLNETTVTWTLGSTGGKVLSAITITPYLNGITAETSRTAATTSSTSYTFTDGQLTGGGAYTFKVSATNANGTSLQSAASNSATHPDFTFMDYLVLAGGGGGGQGGGGGGAGGYRTSAGTSGANSSAEATTTIALATNYTVTVGAGGTGSSTNGAQGSNSVFSTITSSGGGGGTLGTTSGSSGGSGGGGGGGDGSTSGGTGTANQGRNGGAGSGTNGLADNGGGGGGGASTVGGIGGSPAGGTFGKGGDGGAGLALSITGTSVTRAGGGGGSGHPAAGAGGNGSGGTGGGGAANNAGNGVNGTDNTGSGGGASLGDTGGNGGKGVVILRWLTSKGSITIGAGLTGSTATDGSYTVATITNGTGNVSWA
jgi:hypothetical protein